MHESTCETPIRQILNMLNQSSNFLFYVPSLVFFFVFVVVFNLLLGDLFNVIFTLFQFFYVGHHFLNVKVISCYPIVSFS